MKKLFKLKLLQDNETNVAFMSQIGMFLIENEQHLQDIKMNVSYDNEDLTELLENGNFKITVIT